MAALVWSWPLANGGRRKLLKREVLEKRVRSYFDRYPRVAFVHVPKCAGTSAAESLYRALYPQVMKVTRLYGRIDLAASRTAEEMSGVDMMTSRQVALINCLSDPLTRFVSGHVYANPAVVKGFADWKFLTVLRNPVDRFVSEYVYNRYKSRDWLKVADDFEDFLASDRARSSGSLLARYFSGMDSARIASDPDRAVEASLANLQSFASVGFMDDLQGWMNRLEPVLGARPKMPFLNKSPRPALYEEIEASPDLSARVASLCEIDSRIYEEAVRRLAA